MRRKAVRHVLQASACKHSSLRTCGWQDREGRERGGDSHVDAPVSTVNIYKPAYAHTPTKRRKGNSSFNGVATPRFPKPTHRIPFLLQLAYIFLGIASIPFYRRKRSFILGSVGARVGNFIYRVPCRLLIFAFIFHVATRGEHKNKPCTYASSC